MYVNREAIESFMGNNYGGEMGHLAVKAIVTPLLITPEGTTGSILYVDKIVNISERKLHWFVQPRFSY